MEWLHSLLEAELLALQMGHIPYSPNDDKFDANVLYWVESFTTALGRFPTDQRELEARIIMDRQRIKAGFKKIRPLLERWPTPYQVIDLLERRPEVKQLDHDPRFTEDGSSAFDIMTRALCDLSEGKISKDAFDELMEGFKNGCS